MWLTIRCGIPSNENQIAARGENAAQFFCATRKRIRKVVGMGIIRTTVLLAGGLLLLPSPPEEAGNAQLLPVEASYLVAASSALSDVTSFCDRQPAACQTAGVLAARLERNTKYSVKLLYEWANTPDKAEPSARTAVDAGVDPVTTGSTSDPEEASQSTLKIDDLLPPWIGPAPKKG